jgi:hypothetical protein
MPGGCRTAEFTKGFLPQARSWLILTWLAAVFPGTEASHGFATANPETVKAGGRTLSLVRLTITDAGRQALAGS